MFKVVYNPLAIPYALTAVFCGILSLWLFLREDKEATIWRFAILESLLAIIAVSFVFNAKNSIAIAAMLVLAIFLSFVYRFIYGDKIKYRRAILIFGYAVSFAAALLYFTGFLNPSIGLFFYAGIVAAAIIETIVNIAMAESGIFLERLKTATLAYLIALGGIILYFFAPAGDEIEKSILFFTAIVLFSIFQLYALKRKRISEVNDILKKIIAWILSTAIVFIFLYFNLALFRPLIIYDDFRSTGFAFSVLFFFSLVGVFFFFFKNLPNFWP